LLSEDSETEAEPVKLDNFELKTKPIVTKKRVVNWADWSDDEDEEADGSWVPPF
jgi:hypothetical protein